MIRPEALEFPPLNCGLERTLGDYYQDFYGALALVEGGYHGGLDAEGIPKLSVPGQGTFGNAVMTAQYAIANMRAVRRGEQNREGRARTQLDWLVETQEREGPWAGCWLVRYDNQKYRWLRAPWTGALILGNSISALLRGWEMFGEEAYRASAEWAYDALHARRGGAPLFEQDNGKLWYEEYPGELHMRVLNGHIYTLFGVLDYARASGDFEAERRWRAAAATVVEHLEAFDLGYWSMYDLHYREPTSIHYHKNIHIPQLRILASLTGDSRCSDVADRWERYLHSAFCRARWTVVLRVRRFRT